MEQLKELRPSPPRAYHVNAVAFQTFHPVGAAQGNPHGVGHFQRGFPFHAEPHQKAARLGRSHAAIHDVRKACGSHIRRQVLSGGQGVQNAADALFLLPRKHDVSGKLPRS